MFGTVSNEFLEDRERESRNLNFSNDYKASWLSGMGASATQQFYDYNTLGAAEINRRLNLADLSPDEIYDFFTPDTDAFVSDTIIPEEYQGPNPEYTSDSFNQFQHQGYSLEELGIEYEPGHRERYWTTRADIAIARKEREQTIQQSELGTLSQLAAGFGAQIFDPVNFIPLGGVAAKIGLGGKGVMRALGRGAMEGAVGNFVADVALVKPTLERQDLEMGWDEVALDVAFGVGAGGLFGAAGGLLKNYRADTGNPTKGAADPDAAARTKAASDLAAGDDVNVANEVRDPVESRTYMQSQDDYISKAPDTPNRKAFREGLEKDYTPEDVAQVVDILDRVEAVGVAKGAIPERRSVFGMLNNAAGRRVIDNLIKDLPELKRIVAEGDLEEYIQKLYKHFEDSMTVMGDADIEKVKRFTHPLFDDAYGGASDEMLDIYYERGDMGDAPKSPEAERAMFMDFIGYLNGEQPRIRELEGAYSKMKYFMMNVNNSFRKVKSPESAGIKNFFDRMDTEHNTVKSTQPRTKAQKDRLNIESATGEREVLPGETEVAEPLMERLARKRKLADDAREAEANFQKEMAANLDEINKQIMEAEQGNFIRKGDRAALKEFYDNLVAVGNNKSFLLDRVYQTSLLEPTNNVWANKQNVKNVLIQELTGPGKAYDIRDVIDMVDSLYRTVFSDKYAGTNAAAVLYDIKMQIHLEALEAYKTRAGQTIKLAKLERFLNDFDAAHPDRSKAEGLSARMVGSNRPIAGAMQSVDSIYKGKKAKYVGKFVEELDNEGLLKVMRQGGDELELDVARELWEMGEDGLSTKATKNVEAQKIAEIIHKYQRAMVGELNQEGAFIRWLRGYIVRQSHDADKMRGMVSGREVAAKSSNYQRAMNKWRETIKTRLDHDKTFGDPTLTDKQKDKILEDVYVSIITGKNFFGSKAGKGLDETANTLAGRVSQHRKLHFKSADDWHAYHKEYGSKTMFDSVVNGFDRGSQNIATMKVFGPDPQTVFDTIMSRLEREAAISENLAKDLDKGIFGTGRKVLREQFEEVTGASNMVDSKKMARVGSLLRMWQNTTSLGSAAISAIADTPLFTVHAYRMGLPIGKAVKDFWVDTFTGSEWFKTAKANERKQVARALGLGIEGMMADFNNRFTVTEVGGRSAKFHNLFFKATGLQQWTDSHKKGWGIMMANHFTDLVKHDWDTIISNKKFSDLGEMLQSYGFTKADWENLRKVELSDINGNKYMLPENIEAVDAALADMYRTFIVDSADTAIITPGARERAFMHRGLRPGTATGELARMMWQFKSFPLTLYSRVFRGLMQRGQVGGRGFKGQMSNFWDNKGALTSTALLMTTFGGIVTTLKDFTRGREPRVMGIFDDDGGKRLALFFKDSVMAGGATGLLGDTVMGLGQDYGTALAGQFLGPVIGTGIEIGKTFAYDPLAGDFSGKSAIWLIKNNIPYANHFAVRGVMDYFGTYAALEAFYPGYLGKMENKYKRKYGTDYFFAPSDVYYDTYGK